MSSEMVVSCRLCLEPDELDSMVTIVRELGNPVHGITATICRSCARAIADAITAIDEEDGNKPAGAIDVPGAWDAGVSNAVPIEDYREAIERAAPAPDDPEVKIEHKRTHHTGRRTARDIRDGNE